MRAMQGQRAEVGSTKLYYRSAGSGAEVVILLHGWPETSLCWRSVAPILAARFTVIMPDLPGYGLSGDLPAGYDKRSVAECLSHFVRRLDHDRVLVAGHDRGARVAHRWALDQPEQVAKVALLDILPTREVMRSFDLSSSQRMWHWFFHLQPGVPEILLQDHAREYLDFFLHRLLEEGAINAETFAEYVSAYGRSARLHGMLEDYRTSFGIDLERDDSDYTRGHSVRQPLLTLWGSDGGLASQDVIGVWKRYARDVRGRAIDDCGHYLPEERPEEVATALMDFFSDRAPDNAARSSVPTTRRSR